MNLPNPVTSAWWRDKILPVILTAAMCGTFGSGVLMWRELAVISVKLDDRTRQVDDHEQRIRSLEQERKNASHP